MKPAVTHVFLGAMIVFFAVILYFTVTALLMQDREFREDAQTHSELAQQADEERQAAEKLAEDLLADQKRLLGKIEEAEIRLAELERRNERAIRNQLAQDLAEPDQKRIRELAALPVGDILSKMREAIGANNRTEVMTLAVALRENRDKAYDCLVAAIQGDQETGDRYYHLYMLSLLRDPRSLDLYQKILRDDKDPRIRGMAAAALASIPDQSSVPGLINALQTAQDEHVRTNAAAALGVIRDTRAIAPLKEAFLKEENALLRNYALAALAHIADPATTGFLSDTALNSEDEGHRLIAISGLENIGTPEATETLETLASRDSDPVAEEARRALREMSADARKQQEGAGK